MDSDKLIEEILDEVFDYVRHNKGLRVKLERIISRHVKDTSVATPKPRRRKPGVFDPMHVYRETPEDLRPKLEQIGIDELKDIVAEHGMDRSKLAMKWKSKDRLIELITETIASRSQKGDAFRKGPSQSKSD